MPRHYLITRQDKRTRDVREEVTRKVATAAAWQVVELVDNMVSAQAALDTFTGNEARKRAITLFRDTRDGGFRIMPGRCLIIECREQFVKIHCMEAENA